MDLYKLASESETQIDLAGNLSSTPQSRRGRGLPSAPIAPRARHVGLAQAPCIVYLLRPPSGRLPRAACDESQ